MKTIVVLVLLLQATAASATGTKKLTEKFCSSLSNEQLAEYFLEYMALGADDGRPLKKGCELSKAWSSINSQERDEYPQYLVLDEADKVTLKNVIETVDEVGPANVYEVTYLLYKEQKVIKGSFAFSRIYGQKNIIEDGCAFIVKEASPAFIKKSCER